MKFPKIDVIIIGSGISGLSAAVELKRLGKQVLIIDKGFYPGGRLATKSVDNLNFNYGTPCLPNASSANYKDLLTRLTNKNIIRQSNSKKIFWSTKGLREICLFLSSNFNTLQGNKVTRIVENEANILVYNEKGFVALAPKIIISVPAPQAATLLETISPEMSLGAKQVVYASCWTILLGFPSKSNIPSILSFEDESGGLSSIVCEKNSGPEVKELSHTIRMSDKWSKTKLDFPKPIILEQALKELKRLGIYTKTAPPKISYCHLWRYSQVIKALSPDVTTISPKRNIGIAGDWTCGSTIEDAFMSGETIVRALDK